MCETMIIVLIDGPKSFLGCNRSQWIIVMLIYDNLLFVQSLPDCGIYLLHGKSIFWMFGSEYV